MSTANGAKSFAMKEASHILELMEKLLSMDKESSPSDYFSLESELYSHFTNISGLIEALNAIGDDDTKNMVQQLEEKKKILLKIRQTEDSPTVGLDEIDPQENPADVESLKNIDDLADVSQEKGNKKGQNQGSMFNSAFLYAACIVIILVITWIYFSRSD